MFRGVAHRPRNRETGAVMLSLRDVLSLIFKRKMVIFTFFFSLLLVAFVALKIMAPTYASTAKILIKVGREDIYVPSIPSSTVVNPIMSMIREEQLNSEVQILTSDNLGQKLVETMGPEGLYPGMLKKYPWYTPKGVMQTLTGLYKDLESYFAPLSANPDPEQRALKRLMRKDLIVHGTGDSNVIDVTVRSKIPEIAADAANRLVDLYLTERTRIHSDTEGSVFEAQTRDVEERLEKAQTALQAFREQNRLVDVGGEREGLLTRIAEARSMIVDLESKPSEARRVSKWRSELNKLESQISTLGDRELEYVRLMQDVEVLKKSRQLYLEKFEEHKINQALSDARIGNVSVISKAITSSAPIGPKLWMILLACLVVGLAGGGGIALLIEFLDDTIETDSDVKKYLGVPVLGKIGYI